MMWSYYPSFLNLEVQLSELGLPSCPTIQKTLLTMFSVDNAGKLLKDTKATFVAAKAQAPIKVAPHTPSLTPSPPSHVSKCHTTSLKSPSAITKGLQKTRRVKGIRSDCSTNNNNNNNADAADSVANDEADGDDEVEVEVEVLEVEVEDGCDEDGDRDRAGECGVSQGRHDRLTLP
jgi:hypothetical protein